MDKRERFVLFQLPNLPLIVFIIFAVLAKIFDHGSTGDFFKVIAFGSIFTWAWLEIFSGVNYLRRLLGLVVIGVSIFSAIYLLHSLK